MKSVRRVLSTLQLPILMSALAGVDALPAAQVPQFSLTTTAVVVDVVVRSQRRDPVTDLDRSEFEIYENGVRQQITSFRPVNGQAGPAVNDESGSIQQHARGGLFTRSVGAIVFEELGPEGRHLAAQGAETFVRRSSGSDLTGVFVLRRSLEVVLPFTADRAAALKAVAHAASRPGCPLIDSTGEAVNACADDSGHYHRVRGLATFDGLRQVIASMQHLPGRKSILLFSEGLDLATGSREPLEDDRFLMFTRAIEMANRSQVAFYTFDSAGLRARSTMAPVLMSEPYAGLEMLARDTGGAFVHSTNSLVRGVTQAIADSRSYYLIGYTPSNTRQDGSFRAITVKVKRPGVAVLARSGYRATRDAIP